MYSASINYFMCKRFEQESQSKEWAYKLYVAAAKLYSICGRLRRSQELGIRNCMLVVFDSCEMDFMTGAYRKNLIRSGVSSARTFCDSVATCICASLSRGYQLSPLFVSDALRKTYERLESIKLKSC